MVVTSMAATTSPRRRSRFDVKGLLDGQSGIRELTGEFVTGYGELPRRIGGKLPEDPADEVTRAKRAAWPMSSGSPTS